MRRALANFEQAVMIHREVLENFTGDVRVARNLALSYECLGEIHAKIGGRESQPARENYQKCLDILQDLDAKKLHSEVDLKFLERTRAALKLSDRSEITLMRAYKPRLRAAQRIPHRQAGDSPYPIPTGRSRIGVRDHQRASFRTFANKRVPAHERLRRGVF